MSEDAQSSATHPIAADELRPVAAGEPRSIPADEQRLVGADALQARALRAGRAWRRLGWRMRGITPSGLMQFCIVVGVISLLAWLIWSSWGVLTPFIVGAVLAYILLPLMHRLDRWLPRWASIVLVFAVFLGVVVVGLEYLVPLIVRQLVSLAQALPASQTQIDELRHNADKYLNSLPPATRKFVTDTLAQANTAVRQHLGDLIKGAISFVTSAIFGVLNTILFLLGFIITPVWVFYVLMDQRKAAPALDRLLPRWMRADVWAVIRIVDRIFSSWLRGEVVLSLFLAVTVFVGLTALSWAGVRGLHYILLVAVIAAPVSLIPFIGSYLSMLPAILMALVGGGWQGALVVFALFLGLQTVQDNILGPRIIGTRLNLHPALLMPAVIIMGRYGLVFIILAGPVVALGRDLVRYAYGRFDDPPRPAGLLPGEHLPAEVAAETSNKGEVRVDDVALSRR